MAELIPFRGYVLISAISANESKIAKIKYNESH